MFDVLVENAGTIFVFLAIMWIVQLILAYWQMRRFYGRLKVIRQKGLTAVGLGGGKYKGRSYAVLTIDADGKVIYAEKFAGWTIFARLHPVPEMVGMSLHDILNDNAVLPVSKKLQLAFKNAATDLLEAREKSEEEKSLELALQEQAS